MVSRQRSFILGEIPKSLISLVSGILAITAALLTLSGLIVDLIEVSAGITPETQSRLSVVFMGMVAGFGLGMAGWLAAFDAVTIAKSQPHWKMCRVCAGAGIALGILAILSYLVFISLLPAYLPILKEFPAKPF